MLDTAFVIDETDPTGGLRTIADDAAEMGLHLVPVVSPGRDHGHTTAAADLHRLRGAGVVRPALSEAMALRTAGPRGADHPHRHLGVNPEDIDLVLDLGEEANTELVESVARFALANLPHAGQWRTLVLAGAAFPRDLAGVPKEQITRIPRHDWHLYCLLANEASSAGQRVPTFGDYGVAHPDPTLTVNPRFMSISGSLRYTSDDDWLVAKGGELFKGRGGGAGGEAIRPATQMLALHEEFCGADFSEGDRWINRVALDPAASCGNPERWRRTATNHHLAFVTDRLATRRAS
ncbi:hypothetical protein BJF90_39235 [Pseudonocardia sp. CNS-004]|nr:hypothetical protein BJF90_39235 [Pseudonocardia sp. CNS-004]